MELWRFIHQTNWHELPAAVQRQSRRCLLDLIGAGLAGRSTPLSAIVHDFAADCYGGQGATLWLDGRELSPPGAALANGMTVDALDIHDGYRMAKGHAGAAVVPAALATLDLAPEKPVGGVELLASLVIGYEIALRAGEALHATAADYHTSGAWNALGAAAVTARRLRLAPEATRHALGIAEYHGPRSPMMRCIDHPTMLKDGSGWGAMEGVAAAMMAARGFTGAPAELVEDAVVAHLWQDLGQRWRILEQYFKPYAVCRWAQPAVSAALALQRAHPIEPAAIATIRVWTFAEAVRLRRRRPRTTEEAQYSLPFPLAAALVHGALGPEQLSGAALVAEEVLQLADRVTLLEAPELSALFPADRRAWVEIVMDDGNSFRSEAVTAPWSEDDPPGDSALQEKFVWLARTSLPADAATALADTIWQCEQLPDATVLQHLLASPLAMPSVERSGAGT